MSTAYGTTLSTRVRLGSPGTITSRPACSQQCIHSIRCFASQRNVIETERAERREELVSSLPPVRPPQPPPEALPVEWSSAYLYRQRRQALGQSVEEEDRWQLRETEPSWSDDARDVNAAAAGGLVNALKVTADVGKNVLKVALPLGSWAVRQGFKAASGAVQKSGGTTRVRRKNAARRRRDDDRL